MKRKVPPNKIRIYSRSFIPLSSGREGAVYNDEEGCRFHCIQATTVIVVEE
jgi:hypothetical protein